MSRHRYLIGLCLLLAGCLGPRGGLRRALRTDFAAATNARDLAAGYRVYSPDVLDVRVAGRPECCGRRPVRLDGSIELAGGVAPRVEGLSAPQIAARLAGQLRLGESEVAVSVAEHNSQSLYLFGETGDGPQVVAYRGPETVLELFNRLPGAARLSEVGEVHVVRSHVADGKPPEVFHVDLPAILLRREMQTNVRLEPGDRISIGQSKRARYLGQLPPWLRGAGRQKGADQKTAGPDKAPTAGPSGRP
jgi:protein involved in polysaccharide export with SLBB domain